MWRITALDLGALNVPRSNMVYSDSKEQRINVPVIAWLLEDRATGRHILVDTGAAEDEEWGGKYHNPCRHTRANQHLAVALAEQGVDPKSIDTVILTHLHWDHAYGLALFPQAQVVVQRDELTYAIDPTHKDAKIYETTVKEQTPFFLNYYTQFQVVDGDVELEPGLSLWLLPGHSPGSQGVLVETEQGRYLIAGDLVNVVENQQQHVPGSLYTDMDVCKKSYAKVDTLNAIVLPAHDYRAFELLGQKA